MRPLGQYSFFIVKKKKIDMLIYLKFIRIIIHTDFVLKWNQLKYIFIVKKL